jgi:hypothetical protein
MGCNELWAFESRPTFRTNISPSSSWLKSEPHKEIAWNRHQTELLGGLLLRLFFNPEDAEDMFLRNFDIQQIPEGRALHTVTLG